MRYTITLQPYFSKEFDSHPAALLLTDTVHRPPRCLAPPSHTDRLAGFFLRRTQPPDSPLPYFSKTHYTVASCLDSAVALMYQFPFLGPSPTCVGSDSLAALSLEAASSTSSCSCLVLGLPATPRDTVLDRTRLPCPSPPCRPLHPREAGSGHAGSLGVCRGHPEGQLVTPMLSLHLPQSLGWGRNLGRGTRPLPHWRIRWLPGSFQGELLGRWPGPAKLSLLVTAWGHRGDCLPPWCYLGPRWPPPSGGWSV